MANEPFFERDGDALAPNDIARGPWDRESLHGRVLAGLLAQEMEERFGDAGFQPSRLTVDMFRLPRFAPLEVAVEPVRTGRRIRVIDGVVTSEGVEVARGRGVFLQRAGTPEGDVWAPPAWDVPLPDAIPAPDRRQTDFPPMWDWRFVGEAGFEAPGPRRVWMRENRELVGGVPVTPFVAAAQATDFTSPLANAGSKGLQYINADLTLYLHRLPVGEWLGFDVTHHGSADGVATGACTLYDIEGTVGTTAVCAVANQRAPS